MASVTKRDATALAAFLRQCRDRLTPEQAGLARQPRRRVAGLRRDDVAELAGISVTWYTRFETGRAQLSIAALDRVADALRLGRGERRRLLDLARPDVVAAGGRGIDDGFSGLGSTVTALRDLARRCAAATSLAEIGHAATRAVGAFAGPGALSYVRAFEPRADELPIVAVCGPRSDALVGHRQPCATVTYAMKHFVDGRPFAEPDLEVSPCADLRTRIDRVGVRAYHSQPIMRAGGLDLLLGVAFAEPRLPAAGEIGGIEAAAAIVELTLRR